MSDRDPAITHFPGHVPEERIEEYRAVRNVKDAFDTLENWYMSRQRNVPHNLRQARAQVQGELDGLRAPISAGSS